MVITKYLLRYGALNQPFNLSCFYALKQRIDKYCEYTGKNAVFQFNIVV